MITAVHFLLTYTCNFACDHCFLFCGPHSDGVFTLNRLRHAFAQIRELEAVDSVFFEGGEPFLFYPLMLEGIRMARKQGLGVGVVTNSYWATALEDAVLWLKPMKELGLSNISLSDDEYHFGERDPSPAKTASNAAQTLGLPAGTIRIGDLQEGLMVRGRAVEHVTAEMPRRSWDELTECPYEDLAEPKRVHLDPFCHVHICQGLCMGNTNDKSVKALDTDYDANNHPVCGPLLKGGPALLTETFGVDHDEQYVDECHLCYSPDWLSWTDSPST